jgi:hypothetical protein
VSTSSLILVKNLLNVIKSISAVIFRIVSRFNLSFQTKVLACAGFSFYISTKSVRLLKSLIFKKLLINSLEELIVYVNSFLSWSLSAPYAYAMFSLYSKSPNLGSSGVGG